MEYECTEAHREGQTHGKLAPYTQIYIALTDLYRPSVRRIIPSALG